MLYYRDKKNYASDYTRKLILLSAAVIFCIAVGSAGVSNNDIPITDTPEAAETVTVFEYTSDTDNNTFEEKRPAIPVFAEPAEGVLTSSFGIRNGKNHTGIDIGGSSGSDICASVSGTVSYAGWLGGYGNYIVIDHENGLQTAYGHCSSILVSEGERVKQGQKIAYMGSTGNSTGPHLHFEIKQNNEYLNPLDYVMY